MGAVVAVIAGLLVVAAPPAQASYSITFAPSNSVVGGSLALTATVSSGAVGVAVGKVTYYANGASVATATVTAAGAVSPTSWTPMAAGSVPMHAVYRSDDGSQTATSETRTITIDKATTTTTVEMPAAAKFDAVVTVSATVKSSGSYVPTGTVTFLLANDAVLTTSAVDAKGVAAISVQMPAAATTYQLKARYNGDANAGGSTSAPGSTVVSATGSSLALTVGTPVRVGAAVSLTATMTPTTGTGTVTFLVNSVVIGSKALASGSAQVSWTPAAAGQAVIVANLTADGTSVTASATQTVTVTTATPSPQPTGQVDQLTVGPTGQLPWTPGAGYPVRFGTPLVFTTKSSSSSPVTLSVTGPCTINGSTLSVSAGSGTCTLTAKSSGNATLAPATQNYTITLILGQQTAQLSAPPAGRVAKKTSYLLSSAGLKSSAGQPVTWRVTKGSARCRAEQNSTGAWTLRTIKKGTCVVVASAPAVPGQWGALYRKIRYSIR